MPYVNLKVVKEQVNQEQKKQLVDGLMDIIVNIMHRNRDFTVITVDEIDCTNWIIGGNSLDTNYHRHGKVACVTINISRGTSNPEEMAKVIQAGKDLINNILGSCDLTNYFIINELNPESWGFDGISMTIRNKQEQENNG